MKNDPKLTGHFAILKDELARVGATHAKFVELWGGGEAPHALMFRDNEMRSIYQSLVPLPNLTHLFHQERRDPFGPRVDVRFGVHNQDVGVWPICNPHLITIQDVAVSLLVGA